MLSWTLWSPRRSAHKGPLAGRSAKSERPERCWCFCRLVSLTLPRMKWPITPWPRYLLTFVTPAKLDYRSSLGSSSCKVGNVLIRLDYQPLFWDMTRHSPGEVSRTWVSGGNRALSLIRISKDLSHYRSVCQPQIIAPTKVNFQSTAYLYTRYFLEKQRWVHIVIRKPNFGLGIISWLIVLHSLKKISASDPRSLFSFHFIWKKSTQRTRVSRKVLHWGVFHFPLF